MAYLLWNKVRQFNFINYYCFRCRMRFSKKEKEKNIRSFRHITHARILTYACNYGISLFMILITDENDILFKCNTCSLFMITRIYYKLLNVISYYFQQFFIMHKSKYLTNSWNSIDAFIYSSLMAITVY